MGYDKDWTWVLDRTCEECAYEAWSTGQGDLAAQVRTAAATWRGLLGRGPMVTAEPTAGDRTWSVLEYGCHVRDVFELFEARIRLMLKKRKPPKMKSWDPEVAAQEGAYGAQDPAQVAWDLATNAGKVADILDRVNGEEWNKQGLRSDGAEFTVESIVRYMLHDVEHHIFDARELLGLT